MNVVIIGNDRRASALTRSLLSQGHSVSRIPTPPCHGQKRMQLSGQHHWQQMMDVAGILQIIDSLVCNTLDMVVCLHVESSLANLVEALSTNPKTRKCAIFGTSADNSKLEASKSYGMQIASEFGFTVPRWKLVSRSHLRNAADSALCAFPMVLVKTDGLSGGIGSYFVSSPSQCNDILGASDSENFVIQEWVDGEEFALAFVCDGESAQLLNINFEYKRRDEYDSGPNTPGLGSISYTGANLAVAGPLISNVQRLVKARGITGTLDLNFIKSRETGACWFLEFTTRFGDPELCCEVLQWQDTFGILSNGCSKRIKNETAMNKLPWAASIVVSNCCPPPQCGANCTVDFNSYDETACFSAADTEVQSLLARLYSKIAKDAGSNPAYRRDIGHNITQRLTTALLALTK